MCAYPLDIALKAERVATSAQIRVILITEALMTVFLALGGVGILILVLSLVLDDHVDAIADVLGGGDWFTGASLAGFLGALGFGGALVLSLTNNLTLAIISGVLLGLGLGAAVGYVIFRLKDTQEGAAPTSSALKGLSGTVINDIPDEGFGEVRVVQSGQMVKLNARSTIPLKSGTLVTVTDVLSATSVVVTPVYQ
jgi:hypothetical protein